MTLTETEAHKRWCPFASSRVVQKLHKGGTYVSAWEGADDVAPTTYCIASSCMAWRWQDGSFYRLGDNNRVERVEPEEPVGRCGLAGA